MDCSESFDVDHPDNKAAVTQALAELFGVPASFINIILTLLGVGGRRLEVATFFSLGRRLAASIKVDYTVTIPSGSTHTGASVANTMNSATTSQVASKIQTKMVEVLGENFTVAVTNKSSPTITVFTQTTSVTQAISTTEFDETNGHVGKGHSLWPPSIVLISIARFSLLSFA